MENVQNIQLKCVFLSPTCQHGHDTEEDLLYALDRGPALTAGLVPEGVIARGVEDTEVTATLEVVQYYYIRKQSGALSLVGIRRDTVL